jgi:hypothetical protein
MADEACFELSVFAASTTGHSAAGVTRLPEEARNTATAESLDDEHLVQPSSPNILQKHEMSRVPLLLRSSPALGTGKLLRRAWRLCALKVVLCRSSKPRNTNASPVTLHEILIGPRFLWMRES